jgi:hypothetical protein
VEKIGMVLNKKKGLETGFLHASWLKHCSQVSGYLDTADIVWEDNPRWVVYEVDKSLGSEQIEMTGFGIPSKLTRQEEYKVAQVMCYEPALKLLAELYDKVALSVSSLASEKNGNTVIAVGMLAEAGLCDISPKAVRLSVKGKEFVEFLMGDKSLVAMQD